MVLTSDPISAGVGLVSGLFGAHSANKSAAATRYAARQQLQGVRETNHMNMQNYREQRDYDYRLWKEQNAYNDPSAQLSRYENAGINGHLAMSNITPGNAESLQSPDSPAMQNPYEQAGNTYAAGMSQALSQRQAAMNDALNMFNSSLQVQANVEKTRQETNESRGRMFLNALNAAWLPKKFKAELAAMNASTALQDFQLGRSRYMFHHQDVPMADLSVGMANQNLNLLNLDYQQKINDVRMSDLQREIQEEYGKKIADNQFEQLVEQLKNLRKQGKYIDSQTATTYALRALYGSQKKYTDTQEFIAQRVGRWSIQSAETQYLIDEANFDMFMEELRDIRTGEGWTQSKMRKYNSEVNKFNSRTNRHNAWNGTAQVVISGIKTLHDIFRGDSGSSSPGFFSPYSFGDPSVSSFLR